MKELLTNPFQEIYNVILELKQDIADLKQYKEPVDDSLLTKKEAASYLRVSLSTLTNLVNSGQLVKSNIGRNPKFRKSNLDKYLDDNK